MPPVGATAAVVLPRVGAVEVVPPANKDDKPPVAPPSVRPAVVLGCVAPPSVNVGAALVVIPPNFKPPTTKMSY